MDDLRTPMDPDEAERRFAERLDEASLPPFVSAEHDTELELLEVSWAHGIALSMDLTRDAIVEPIDEHGRAVILGLKPCSDECAAAVDVSVPGSPDDPRTDASMPGVGVRHFTRTTSPPSTACRSPRPPAP